MMLRWLGLLGWCMTLSSLWLIPGYGLYLYFTTEGTPQQSTFCMVPQWPGSSTKS